MQIASEKQREQGAPHTAPDQFRLNEERLRLTQSAMRIGAWTFDLEPDEARNHWSPEGYAISGFDPTWRPNYAEWLAHIHPDDRGGIDGAFQAAIAGATPDFVVTYRLIGMDGIERWQEARGRVMRDDAGAPLFAHGIFVDITQRKQTEAALDTHEQRFGVLFQSPIAGFTVFDANTLETLAINDRMLELTGHTRAEFEGDMWDWATFTPPECMPLDDAAIRQARTHGFWQPYEKEYVHKDGKRVPVRLSSVPVPGEPGRVIVCVEDLSREKAARAELEAQVARLELALSAAELGVFEWRMSDMSAVWGNCRMYDIFARAPERGPIPCSDFLRKVLHPDDRRTFEAQIVAAAAGGPFAFKGRVVRDDGVERRIASRGFFEATDKGLRLVGVVADITEEPR